MLSRILPHRFPPRNESLVVFARDAEFLDDGIVGETVDDHFVELIADAEVNR
jgi:hypothetical protein